MFIFSLNTFNSLLTAKGGLTVSWGEKEILFTTEHVRARTLALWHTSQSLCQHTHRGAKNSAIIGTSASSHTARSDSQARRQSNQHHIHTREHTH